MLEAQLLAARALYLNGNLDAAQRKAADILRVTPDAYMVHLLICRLGGGRRCGLEAYISKDQ